MNEMNEREQDVMFLAEYRRHSAYVYTYPGWYPRLDDYEMSVQYIKDNMGRALKVALSQLDRLTDEYQSQLEAFRDAANERQRRLAEERDAARSELATLRKACEGVPVALEVAAGEAEGIAYMIGAAPKIKYIEPLRAKAAELRAALGIESEASE